MPTKYLPSLILTLALAAPLLASPPSEPDPVSASQPAAKTPASQPTTFGKPITTEIKSSESITYKSGNRDIKALLITPQLPGNADPKTAPAIILVHDIFGMTPFIKAQAEILAKQGYTVLVPNLYSRLENADGPLDEKTAAAAYEKTSDSQVTSDLAAAIDYLEPPPVEGEPPSRRIAIVGHDMGGIYAMMLAADIRVTAAVNYYGRILYAAVSKARPSSPIESLFNLHAPLLNFYGDIDPQVPPDQIEALESRLSHNPSRIPYETIHYPNVGHSFLNPARPGYNEAAAKQTAEKTKSFLAEHLRAEPEKPE